MNNLPKVVTQQRRGRASNPRLLDRKSDALPLSHRATTCSWHSDNARLNVDINNVLSLHAGMQVIDLPSPHGNCEPSEDYVQSKCLADCEANYVIGKCNCKDIHMPGERTTCVEYSIVCLKTGPL